MPTPYAAKADIVGLGEEFTIPAAWSDVDVAAAIVEEGARIDLATSRHFSLLEEMSVIVNGNNTALLFLSEFTSHSIVSVDQIQYRDDFNQADDFDAEG